MPQSELVSVVMPSLNQAQYLEVAVRSVLEQDHALVELIVADGLSTDGSVELLSRLQREYGQRLMWTSVKDSCAAQAINRALAQVRGKYVGWLNSDDMYLQGAISRAVQHFQAHKEHQMVYGQGRHIGPWGEPLGMYPSKPPSTPLDAFHGGSFICQPTVFMRKEAIDHVGLLDESIQTAFDFDWWLRFFKRYPRQVGFIRRIQAHSRLHPSCMTQRLRKQVALDGLKVTATHLGEAMPHWVWTHLEEMCEAYPLNGHEVSLIKGLEAFLIETKPYLKPEVLKDILQNLKQDYRFGLCKPGLFASVQPDGWVSKNLQVRYRWNDKPAKAVNVRCNAAWPKTAKMKLRVRTPDGGVQLSTIEAPSDFILRLEVPPSETAGYIQWSIDTAQAFVPAAHDKASSDKRHLSFRVQELTLEA